MNDNDTNAANNPYSAPQSNVSEEVIHDGQLGTLGERFGAALVDGLIGFAVTIIPAIFIFGGWMGYLGAAAANPMMFRVAGGAIGVVIFMLIHGVFLARDGQTVGKKVMKIKIVRTDGSRADFGRLIGYRYVPVWLCQMVPYIGPLVGFIDILFIFRSSRRCIHDDIADTKVVKA